MARAARVRPACRVAFAGLVLVCFSGLALGKDADDGDDESAKAASAPNVYLDLRTNYATFPAGSLSVGFGGFGCSPGIPRFRPSRALAGFRTFRIFRRLPALSSPSSQSIGLDVPLTIDFNDRVSVYGGFSASASRSDTVRLVGVHDLQLERRIPGRRLSAERRIDPDDYDAVDAHAVGAGRPLPTTSLNTILEFDYALNADETRGLLAGVQYTAVAVESRSSTVNPNIIGYVGGYYQWDNNWKFTGRVGVQSFGGAQLLNRTPFQPFTQPIVRLDLDRMDDDDNRLFGVTAQIAWMPKPSYQLTVRTPLYLVKN